MMLTITFVTMMFGAGMPILFPIAAAAFTVMYIVENFGLYYTYKEPIAYDEKLNNFTLRILEKAPMFLLGFGYWMFSNHQLLDMSSCAPIGIKNEETNFNKCKKLVPITNVDSTFFAEHIWYEAFTF